MEIDNRNIPYEQMAQLGISREMIEVLPENVKNTLLKGGITPLMEIKIKADNNAIVTFMAKLQLLREQNNSDKLILMAYPIKNNISEETIKKYDLSVFDTANLCEGNVLHKTIEGVYGRTNTFLQLDPETKSVLARLTADVELEKRIMDIERIKDFQLGSQQKQAIREGKPVELTVGDEKVSVGVDLKEPDGFKVMTGDLKEWEKKQQIAYDIAHPEFIGLVQTDKNRWEYQQVKDEYLTQRNKPEESVSKGIKL